jgi:putative tryptophan/tyrosine transport system substrate-binding protein
MNRRAFVTGLGAVLATPLAAEAQQAGRVPRIGFISMRSGPSDNAQLDAFRQGLRELGYLEGRNVVLEIRYAGEKFEKLPDLAADLVRLKVDVIVTQSGVAGLAAKEATQTIPIVMASSGDAVRQGLVMSLARPGGNVTGLTMISPELSQKRLEVLRELLPKLSRAGVIWCAAGGAVADKEWTETLAAADVLKVKLSSLEVRGPQDLASAFVSAARQRLEAIIVFDCSLLHPSAARITELSMENRLPALYPFALYPTAGGLMSYGPDLRDGAHRAAGYVDKILKGAKPADLPVELPTKFQLIINLKTAKALGLTIPPSLLLRADQVLE